MRLRLVVAAAALAVVAVACGGGAHPASQGTSTAGYQELRDALRTKLGAIGVNIGSVPPDVRDQILSQCRDLARFADQQRVNDLCDAVQRAMDTGDFGLLDQIIDQLGRLQPK